MNVIESSEQFNRLSEAVIPSPPVPARTTSDADEWLLATYGRTFHFAARFLSPKLRREVVTLYAFFRTLDDLVDSPEEGRQSEDIRQELCAWQRWFSGSRAFPAPREPLGAKLAAILGEQRVPTALFLDFLEGMLSDLEPQPLGDFQELYRYCYRVAGTVGLAMSHLLGARSAAAQAAAVQLGIGMQLTNILRDVGSDLANGRLYLPQDELARFDCSAAQLARLLQEPGGSDERFRALMRFQVARARGYYVRGMAGIWLLPADGRLPILLASRLYRRILSVIERQDYDVLHTRASTRWPEKLGEAAIALVLTQLWSRGEGRLRTQVEVLFEE